MSSKFDDLKNKKFGKLSVLNEYKVHLTKRHWKCICDCGNIKFIRALHLKNGSIISCGCSKKISWNWQGYGDISAAYLTNIKSNAKKRNLVFKLTIEQLWELFLKQNRKCSFTNVDLKFVRNYAFTKKHQTASLDRIDTSKGYILGNVRWVHKVINGMKMKINDEIFLNFCRLVAEANLPILEAGRK